MTDWFPRIFGIGPDVPFQWMLALAIGIAIGAAIGALQGFIIAYIGVPSFIVTLGGLLSIRGLVWFQSQGAAVAGLDPTFQLIGGGAQGSVGGTVTWILGILGCLAIVASAVQRPAAAAPLRLPAPAHVGGGAPRRWSAAPRPRPRLVRQQQLLAGGPGQPVSPRSRTGSAPPGGLQIPTGFPLPIVLLIGVTLVMSFIATRRRFGRYVYAYGGNPDAAELAGINTRWTIMKTYILMGILCALAAAIAAARLNGATLDIGVELRALRDRRRGRRRHVVRRRHRDHPGSRPRGLRHAVARPTA